MKAILFNENGPLLPVTRQKVDKLRETLINDKLTPWRWFNFRIVDITDFYGKTIFLGGKGTFYGLGTEVLVFFSFIKPFLEDAIVKIFDETIETCRVRGLKPVEPYIREAAMLLEGHLIYPIYNEMVDIDQHLRGKGNPKNVGRRNVVEESAEMRKILDERKNEIIQGLKEIDLASTKLNESQPVTFSGKKPLYKLKTFWFIVVGALSLIACLLNISDSGTFRGIIYHFNQQFSHSQSASDPNAQTDSNAIMLPSKTNHDMSNSLPDSNLSSPESPNQ